MGFYLFKKGAQCAFLLCGFLLPGWSFSIPPQTTASVKHKTTIPVKHKTAISAKHKTPAPVKSKQKHPHTTHPSPLHHPTKHHSLTHVKPLSHLYHPLHPAPSHPIHPALKKSLAIVHSLDFSHLTTYQDSICRRAAAQLGTPYQWGGVSPRSGFDCSGFSQYVYRKQGIEIPRTALEQYNTLTPVIQPKPGDLVFFRTEGGQKVTHVGIYLGRGYFIHSPRTGENIRVDNLNSNYWKERYAGARRVFNWHYSN